MTFAVMSAASKALGRNMRPWVLAASLLIALSASLVSLTSGPFHLSADAVWGALNEAPLTPAEQLASRVVIELRAPRVVLAMLVGAALAVAGAAFQGLFRNPLADPSLLGISSGAATGAVGMIVLGLPGTLSTVLPHAYGLPIAAVLGAIVATALLYILGRRDSVDLSSLILTGIALNAVCAALSGILVFTSNDQQLRELTFWSMGSLARASWSTLLPAAPFLVVAILALIALANAMNALSLGDAAAHYLGIDVRKSKLLTIAATATAVGVAVALTGVIAFVGLMVPHIARALVGADNRWVFAVSAAGGAGLMVCADLAARVIVSPAELPIGIVTSMLGGPFFLYLMACRRVES